MTLKQVLDAKGADYVYREREAVVYTGRIDTYDLEWKAALLTGIRNCGMEDGKQRVEIVIRALPRAAGGQDA